MKKRNPWIVPTVLLLVVTAVLGAAIPVTNYYETMINAALNAETQKIVPDPDAQIFYWTEYEDEDALVAHDMETCYRVEAEGAALLLNRDHTLPLPADTKFTLFSQSVADPVMTGTGSAFMATGDAISLYGALEASFAPASIPIFGSSIRPRATSAKTQSFPAAAPTSTASTRFRGRSIPTRSRRRSKTTATARWCCCRVRQARARTCRAGWTV